MTLEGLGPREVQLVSPKDWEHNANIFADNIRAEISNSRVREEEIMAETKAKSDQELKASKFGSPLMDYILTDLEENPWKTKGQCRDVDPDVFYPHDEQGVEVAKKVCRGCSVSRACLEFALNNHEDYGVWGGASERERRRIAKRRRLAS